MSGPRSVVSWLLALSAIFSIAGCGNFWPWSGPKKPKMPDPPAISAPAAARQAWSIDLGPGGIGLVPAFAQDSVFAANRKGIILRLDVTTGQERWRVDLGRKVVAGVGTDARLVVVGLDDGGLVALDSDGKQKWSVTIGTQAATVPAVGHGVVVVRTGDNRVQAFEADTGKRRWSFTRQNPSLVLHQSSGITLTPSSAYVGLPGGRLVALDLASGAVRWEVAVAQPRGATEIERIADIVGTPMLRSGQVCAANYNGRLACFDTASGTLLWSREIRSATGLELDSNLVVAVDEKDQIHAFSLTGSSVWRQAKFSGRILSAPTSVGPVLVLGDSKGLVHLVSRNDGAVVGRFSGDGTAIVAQPVAAGRTALVQSTGGALIAVSID